MATTVFFERTIKDKKDRTEPLDLEFGRCSAYGGESLLYIKVNDEMIIVDEKIGKEICRSMEELSHYLGYANVR